MKVILSILLLPAWASALLFGQNRQNPVRHIQANFVERQPVELGHPLYMDLEVTLANGKTRVASNQSLWGMGWSRFNVWVEEGYFHRGLIYLNQAEFWPGSRNRLKLWISHQSNPTKVDTFYYQLPQLSEVSLKPKNRDVLQPGRHGALSLSVTYDNGRSYQEDASLWGPLFKARKNELGLQVSSTAELKGDHFVYLPRSIFYTDEVQIIAQHPQANLADTLFIPVDYQSRQVLDFSGSDGSSGFWGEHGDLGESGSRVDAYVQLLEVDGRSLLRVKAVSESRTDYALLDLDGQGLIIDVGGGDGGDGGDGDDGDDGRDETKAHQATRGENGEAGGSGGQGGDGGQVTFYTDQASQGYIAQLIEVRNLGGDGGDAGEGGEGGDGGKALNGSQMGNGADGPDGQEGSDGLQGPQSTIEIQTSAKLERILTGMSKI
ncbi:MAG: hypothetical protein AAF804_06270 [Bacteroidota bacterium]